MRIDPKTGLRLNRAGRVIVYHGTKKAAAEKIRASGRLISAGEPRVYFTTDPAGGDYGDTVIKVEIDPSMLDLDDEFPGGRKDFSVPVSKHGLRVKVSD